ncbi:hypothetical protein RAM80_23970 [Pseudomonas sp. App30]|uniref:hypothetical protein n=1 Tax=Pseudomonas sp. App30 TaxID=3068990 RepID=UPI003A7FDC0F
MSTLHLLGWRHALIAFAILFLFTFKAFSDDPEIALVIGEPYEDMRQRSSAYIPPALPGEIWFNIPDSDARLNFIDPTYGFVTPLARFFTVIYDKGLINSVRMSPQIEPLLLDETLKVALDLQDQWRRTGWTSTRPDEFPPIAGTPAWQERIQQSRNGIKTYWQAGDQYQIMLMVGRFADSRHPGEERYLISLSLAEPWVKPWEAYDTLAVP